MNMLQCYPSYIDTARAQQVNQVWSYIFLCIVNINRHTRDRVQGIRRLLPPFFQFWREGLDGMTQNIPVQSAAAKPSINCLWVSICFRSDLMLSIGQSMVRHSRSTVYLIVSVKMRRCWVEYYDAYIDLFIPMFQSQGIVYSVFRETIYI